MLWLTLSTSWSSGISRVIAPVMKEIAEIDATGTGQYGTCGPIGIATNCLNARGVFLGVLGSSAEGAIAQNAGEIVIGWSHGQEVTMTSDCTHVFSRNESSNCQRDDA